METFKLPYSLATISRRFFKFSTPPCIQYFTAQTQFLACLTTPKGIMLPAFSTILMILSILSQSNSPLFFLSSLFLMKVLALKEPILVRPIIPGLPPISTITVFFRPDSTDLAIPAALPSPLMSIKTTSEVSRSSRILTVSYSSSSTECT